MMANVVPSDKVLEEALHWRDRWEVSALSTTERDKWHSWLESLEHLVAFARVWNISPERDKVVNQAVRWYIRLTSPKLSPRHYERWCEWHDKPGHEPAFTVVTAVAQKLNKVVHLSDFRQKH